MGWVRAGATYGDYAAERYRCLQEASQRVSSAAVDQGGGAASSAVYPSLGIYNACMQAHGWRYVQDGFTGALVQMVE
jgi:hypothetical protein